MSSLTSIGLVIDTLQEIKAALESSYQFVYGNSIDLDPSGPFGQEVGIYAEREAVLQELLEAVYNAFDPDGAIGIALDQLCALTGTVRLAARSSIAAVVLTGDDLTSVPAANVITTASTEERFLTSEVATFVALTAWTGSNFYTVGNRIFTSNDQPTTSGVYVCTASGTSDVTSTGGPKGFGSSITDNDSTWDYVGNGQASADVFAVSEKQEAIVALAGDLTVIDTPVSGWLSANNLVDANLGNISETDPALRIRREVELTAGGKGIFAAVFAAISAVDGVTSLKLFENENETTDSEGVPAKSFEALLEGGVDSVVGQAILDTKPLGIKSYGSTTVTVEDSEETEHSISFSRPSNIEIHTRIELIYDVASYPSDGDTQVKLAITTLNTEPPGHDAVSTRVIAKCFTVAGVLDITLANIGLSNNPTTDTTVAIGTREQAVYSIARNAVTSSSSTP